jgi:hypothetical protein
MTQTVTNIDGSFTTSSSFSISGPKWNDGEFGSSGGNVTWSFAEFNYSSRFFFSQTIYDELKDDVRRAFDTWESVADINFIESSDTADTNIRLGMNFIDGENNTLGTAYTSFFGNEYSNADIELDLAEDWSGSLPYLTLLHEIGHTSGLGHDDSSLSIMNSIITENLTGLTEDDINGIIEIYGSSIDQAFPPSTTITALVSIDNDYKGAITASNDVNLIRVQLSKGVDYTIELRGIDTGAGSLKDPFLSGIYNSEGNFLGTSTSDNDSGIGLNSLITFTSQTTGDYYISAESFGIPSSEDNTYTLSIKQTSSSFKGDDFSNIFIGIEGIDYIDYSASVSEFTILKGSESDIFFIDHADGVDQLIDIERIRFSDKIIAFDIDGNAGKAYRLYKASLDREPDTLGLGYWINDLDNNSSLEKIGEGFINSTEFQQVYGPSPSTEEFITLLYDNVLNRSPDQEGLSYWTNDINSGLSYAGVLASFSESDENKENVIGIIDAGIRYDEWIVG